MKQVGNLTVRLNVEPEEPRGIIVANILDYFAERIKIGGIFAVVDELPEEVAEYTAEIFVPRIG